MRALVPQKLPHIFGEINMAWENIIKILPKEALKKYLDLFIDLEYDTKNMKNWQRDFPELEELEKLVIDANDIVAKLYEQYNLDE